MSCCGLSGRHTLENRKKKSFYYVDQVGDVLLIERQPRDALKPWDMHAEHTRFYLRRTVFGVSQTIPADLKITASAAASS